jgi:hypothetical protein
MNHDQQRPDAQEQQLLAHFREHSNGEPSAELDALILNAARAELARPPRLSRAQRLHNWLFGAGRQRWSLAVAGVACVGIGVSLTWRTLDRTPDAYDAVPGTVLMAPAVSPAPAYAPMAGSAAVEELQARKRLAEPEQQKSEHAQRLGRSALSDELQAPPMPQAILAEPAAPQALKLQAMDGKLQSELQRLHKLRADGWMDEADQLLLELMREYPQVNIEAALKQLAPTE